MTTNKIKILLAKFYQGETTLEEEKLLKKYFAEDNVDNENFNAEKYLFNKLNLSENIEIPSDLTDKIVVKIDEQSKRHNAGIFTSFINLRVISIAACCALLFSVASIVLLNSEKPKYIANVSTNEAEIIEMLENSFSKISSIVDDAVILLDVTGEQVCELSEALREL